MNVLALFTFKYRKGWIDFYAYALDLPSTAQREVELYVGIPHPTLCALLWEGNRTGACCQFDYNFCILPFCCDFRHLPSASDARRDRSPLVQYGQSFKQIERDSGVTGDAD